MDLKIEGRPTPRSRDRPPSRPRVDSRNPITGLKGTTPRVTTAGDKSSYQRPVSTKPDSVPALDLKFLGKDMDVLCVGPEITARGTPHTSSTVSWGTARSYVPRALPLHVPVIPLKGTDRPPVKASRQCKEWPREPDIIPIDLVPPSARYKTLYKKYEDEMKQAYQNHVAKQPLGNTHTGSTSQSGDDRQIFTDPSAKKLNEEKSSATYPHSMYDETTVNTCPVNLAVQKKLDAEVLIDHKKKAKLIETVMIDQLSRAVISEPEQDERSPSRSGSTSGMTSMTRGAIRTMHDSKVTTRASCTENLLSRRVRFGARILSGSNVDAVKELTGFYFHVDQSLTIYEYRQFGKTAKALPFINRGRYAFQRGPRVSQTYRLTDIYAGANLEVAAQGQQSIPTRLREAGQVVVFRVTDVDDAEKREILLAGVHPALRQDEYIKCHIPTSGEEIERRVVLLQLQEYTRNLLKPRGVKTVLGMWRECHMMDQQSTGRLSRYDLEKLAIQYRIEPPNGLTESVLDTLDYDQSGYVEYAEFLRALLGEMNERLKSYVRRSFLKMDHSRSGAVSYSDVRKFFSARAHPAVLSGESTEEEALAAFLASFLTSRDHEEITYTMFEAYYEGLCVTADTPDLFIRLLRNTWGI